MAVLMVARKYMQDDSLPIYIWSHISRRSIEEINLNEKIFLDIIKWRVYMIINIYNR